MKKLVVEQHANRNSHKGQYKKQQHIVNNGGNEIEAVACECVTPGGFRESGRTPAYRYPERHQPTSVDGTMKSMMCSYYYLSNSVYENVAQIKEYGQRVYDHWR